MSTGEARKVKHRAYPPPVEQGAQLALMGCWERWRLQPGDPLLSSEPGSACLPGLMLYLPQTLALDAEPCF